MGFKDRFGFEPPATVGGALPVHQFVVDTEIGHLAREAEATQHSIDELNRRFLANGQAKDAASLLVVLTAMQRYEASRDSATAAFEEAMKLARDAGFTARGEIVDYEARRIFGLDVVHKPLTKTELSRIEGILSALAKTFELAEMEERVALSSLPAVPTPDLVSTQNVLKERILAWRARFWEAHVLAQSLGVKVLPSRDDYLPHGWIYSYLKEKREVVEQARKDGLIPAA